MDEEIANIAKKNKFPSPGEYFDPKHKNRIIGNYVFNEGRGSFFE